MKLQTLQILQIFIECRNIVGGASVHISKHSLFRLNITVGCRLCWCCVDMCGVRVVCVYVYVYVCRVLCVCVEMVVHVC